MLTDAIVPNTQLGEFGARPNTSGLAEGAACTSGVTIHWPAVTPASRSAGQQCLHALQGRAQHSDLCIFYVVKSQQSSAPFRGPRNGLDQSVVQHCPSCNAMKGTKTPPGTRPIRHASVRDVPPPVARSKRVIKRLVPLAPAAAQASRCRQKHTERTHRTRAAEGIHTAPAAETTAAPQQNRAHGPLTRLQAQFAAVLNGEGDARQFMVEALTSGSFLGGVRRGGGR